MADYLQIARRVARDIAVALWRRQDCDGRVEVRAFIEKEIGSDLAEVEKEAARRTKRKDQ